MIDEKKRKNSQKKLFVTSLNEAKSPIMASSTRILENRRTSFNKPRPPRPISKIPGLNPTIPIGKSKKTKTKDNDDLKNSKSNDFVIELNMPSDKLNNNLKLKGLELICNGDLVDTPQTPNIKSVEEHYSSHAQKAKANKPISDIYGFKLDDAAKSAKKNIEAEEHIAVKKAMKQKNLMNAQSYLPSRTISDIPGLSNLINEKLKQLAVERNRDGYDEETPSEPPTPTPSELATPTPSDLPTPTSSEMSTPTPSEYKSVEELLSKTLDVNEVLDETFRRLTRKGVPLSRQLQIAKKADSKKKKTDSNKKKTSSNKYYESPTSLLSPISKIPGLNPEKARGESRNKEPKIAHKKVSPDRNQGNIKEESIRMKGLMNGQITNTTPADRRKGSEDNENEIPVIEQLISKKKTTKEVKDLTRPDLIPVDNKAKIYFLINHNEGRISHVIKSIKTTFPRPAKK